jgi:hypothetical protein
MLQDILANGRFSCLDALAITGISLQALMMYLVEAADGL